MRCGWEEQGDLFSQSAGGRLGRRAVLTILFPLLSVSIPGMFSRWEMRISALCQLSWYTRLILSLL